MAAAATSLRHFKRQQIQGVNPDCLTQLKAYITLRETHSRVQPQQFLNYLKTLTTSVSTGAETYQEFWAVPRANFLPGGQPGTMSAAITAALADPLACDGLIIDHDVFHVIDQSIPRTDLGIGVWAPRKFGRKKPPASHPAPAWQCYLGRLPWPCLAARHNRRRRGLITACTPRRRDTACNPRRREITQAASLRCHGS